MGPSRPRIARESLGAWRSDSAFRSTSRRRASSASPSFSAAPRRAETARTFADLAASRCAGEARATLGPRSRGARQGELRREVGARALVQLEAAQAVPRERLRGGQQRGEVRRQRPIARDRASARGRPGGGDASRGRRGRGGPRRERARRRPRVRPGRRRGRERRHRANAAAERFLALLISADPRTNAQKRPRPSRRRAPRRRPARRAERGDGKEAVGARARGRRDRADRYEGARDGGSRRGAKATARSLPASD